MTGVVVKCLGSIRLLKRDKLIGGFPHHPLGITFLT